MEAMTLEQVRDRIDRLAGENKVYAYIHLAELTEWVIAIDAHLAHPAQAVDVGGDTRRIDHLERLIQCAYLGACFELDGGIHLTIEAPGSEPVAYRYKNNLREAIDADIASGGDHQA